MDFWKKMNMRWDRESLCTWSSLQRTVYILFPLLVYFLVHDMVEILLWAAINFFVERAAGGMASFAKQNAYSIRGLVYGLAILAGVAAIRRGVLAEINNPRGIRQLSVQARPLDSSSAGINVAPPAQMEGSGKKEKLFGPGTDRQIREYMFLGALAFLSSFGLNLFFWLIGFTESSQAFSETVQAQFGVDFLIGLVLYGVLSPIAEEAVFRGLIYNRMKRCFRYEIALVTSALLFGLYHGNLVQAVYGMILGLLMAYMYELYHSFAAPVLFHAVANVSIYVLTYHQGFVNMDRSIGMAAAAVSLLGAAGCFFYIRKCINKTDNNNK